MSPLPDNATIRLTCDAQPSQGKLAVNGQIKEGLVLTGIAVSGAASYATGTLNLQSENAVAVGKMTSNPSDASSVTIGGTVYTFKNTLATSNQVKIGGDVQATLANLMAAVNDSGGEGTAYGTGTTAHTDVDASIFGADRIIITAKDAGSAGTVFTVATSGTTNLTWNTVNLALACNPQIGDTVTVGASTYTFKAAISTANDVLIGATPLDTVTNLERAVNDLGGTEGVHYGTGTTANASATATARTTEASVLFTAITSGSSGNSVATTSSLAVGGFATSTLVNGAGASRLPLSALKDGDFVIAQFAIDMFSVSNPVGATVDYGRTQGYVRKGDYWDGTSFMLFSTPDGDAQLAYDRDDIIDPARYPANIANLVGYSFSQNTPPVINVYASTHLDDATIRARMRITGDDPDLKPATLMEEAFRAAMRVEDDPLLTSASASSVITGITRFRLTFEAPPIVTQAQECAEANAFAARLVTPLNLLGGYLRLDPVLERMTWRHPATTDLAPDVIGSNGFAARMIEPPDLLGNEYLSALTRLAWRHSGEILIEGIGMTLDSVVLDCISHWGFTSIDKFNKTKFSYLQERIVNDLNSVLQIIYSKAKLLSYFNRERRTFTVAQNATEATVPFDVQEVLGYIRRVSDGATLVRVDSLPEIERWTALYAEADNSGLPIAYHIQRQTQERFDWDVTRITLRVAPAPANAAVELYAECAIQAPRYDWNAVLTRTPLSLPHTYCESLLLPLLRYRCLTCEFADGVDQIRRAQLAQEYQRAATTLQLVDPAPRKLDKAEKEAALAS